MRKQRDRRADYKALVREYLSAGSFLLIPYAAVVLTAAIWQQQLPPFIFTLALFAPVWISAPVAIIQRFRYPHKQYLGWICAYRLTETHLTCMLGRAIPFFRVALKDIKTVEPWHHLGRFAWGSDESAIYYFLGGIWFWPAPLTLLLKKVLSVQAKKMEYTLATKHGWIIVICSTRAFVRELEDAVKQALDDATIPATKESTL